MVINFQVRFQCFHADGGAALVHVLRVAQGARDGFAKCRMGVGINSSPIPANDDASKSIQLIVGVISKAIEDGMSERKVDKEDAERKEADEAAIAEKTAADTAE